MLLTVASQHPYSRTALPVLGIEAPVYQGQHGSMEGRNLKLTLPNDNDYSQIHPERLPLSDERPRTKATGRKRSSSTLITKGRRRSNTASSSPTRISKAEGTATESRPNATKSKRVRTGCLTCRERHLKCDEGAPDCVNCKKSNRNCKRGIRLNFLDITVYQPPIMAMLVDWSVQFYDESREIASEYRYGIDRYTPYGVATVPCQANMPGSTAKSVHRRESIAEGKPKSKHRSLSSSEIKKDHPFALYSHSSGDGMFFQGHDVQTRRSSAVSFVTGVSHQYQIGAPSGLQSTTVRHRHRNSSVSSNSLQPPIQMTPSNNPKGPGHGTTASVLDSSPRINEIMAAQQEFLQSSEEIQHMRTFVEDVAIWMDSFDKEKHFGRVVPYQAVGSPMLRNALLACGAKQSSFFSLQGDDKALFYYNSATTQLLRHLENADRNTSECAVTAVILNVFEIMCEKSARTMNHIAGARALIRECGWNAQTTGIGSACFWLNIGMELLGCLSSNQPTTWDPDHWGLDMNFSRESPDGSGIGQEEPWVQRILFILAKAMNFRAGKRNPDMGNTNREHSEQRTVSEWRAIKEMCDRWNSCCPRSMHPLAYSLSYEGETTSTFPRAWLIKRASVVGRLFYHTTQCILTQSNPLQLTMEEMRATELQHARQICGIVAHTTDRGVISVAIKSLTVAAAILVDSREQVEALSILDRISKQSGWRLGMIGQELKRAWRWEEPGLAMSMWHNHPAVATQHVGTSAVLRPQPHPTVTNSQTQTQTQTPAMGTRLPMPTMMTPPSTKAEVNPLGYAEFNLPSQPYQGWYEPSNRGAPFNQHYI